MASLRISDGRNSFFQWDLNQKLIIDNPSVCNKVHFTNSSRDMALVAEVKTDENGVKYVDVPNSLLTMPLTLEVYLYQDNGDCKTTVSKYGFDVVKRDKPENYVYTEDEHKDFDELFIKMEQNIDVSKQALDEYVLTVKEPELDEYTNLKKDDIRGVYSADLSAEATTREEADTLLSNKLDTKADVTYVDGGLAKKVSYTDSLTYEEIMATTELSGKVSSASALQQIGGRILVGRSAFPIATSTGKQEMTITFNTPLPNKPKAVFLTWRDDSSIASYCDGLNVTINSESINGFSVNTKRLKVEYQWNFAWLVIY